MLGSALGNISLPDLKVTMISLVRNLLVCQVAFAAVSINPYATGD